MLMKHVGSITSQHIAALQKWDSLRNSDGHIERVLETRSLKDVEDNRLRLTTSIESVRLLANQGAPFRGHDESKNSLNRGYFQEVIKSFSRMSVDIERVVLENAPRNSKYTSPSIQKQILNILCNKVTGKIRDEVGNSKYCILVDEAIDVSVKDMRGQGYDDASNMRGIYNGLQALFIEECPYAYFVHYFAHRFQLVLNATAQGVKEIWSLIELFSSIKKTLNDMIDQGNGGQAEAILGALRSFEFVFCLLLMNKVLKVTDFLCQTLQRKSLDFVHAMIFVGLTKSLLQEMREEGWEDLLSELNKRFSDQASELLILSSTLDPRDNFKSFKAEDVCNLAKKFYPEDFDDGEMFTLQSECAYYEKDMRRDPKFQKLESIADLCHTLVLTRKSEFFPMLYRLICLVLTIHVSTTTTKRAFSAMNIINNKLRNKMEDEFLGDCMVLHIEKEMLSL
ncbi:uncharacterized protein LOC126803676 [Argentina anserina]|uniref:uncharacterized protein LOC126803676 n=1 Tax=Argentina anserina TaxID=57926 RepID=UPI0021765C7B|nr:uncharacterized protein LOC126803676 [Potentilla anserina]